MNLLTNFGYTLKNADSFTDFLTTNEFNALTANKYAGDTRIGGLISAASQAIRDFCGWHIYPEASCEMTERILYGNGRMKQNGSDLLIQLPSAYVVAVSAVTLNNEALTDYAIETNGLLRIFDICHRLDRKSEISVTFTSGLPAALMDGIKELVAHRVTHALASSAGVQSETAGGVSVTYSANWINSSRATALASDNKEVLMPYKVSGVF